MKRVILMMMATVAFLASCTEDPIPPTAGFTLSSETAVQWDVVTVSESATGAEATSYTVSGGAYEMDDATLTIQFLEAATYTVTQTATNADGNDEVSVDIVITAPVNTYKMTYYSDSDLPIVGDAYEFLSMGTVYQLRFDAEGVSAQEHDALVKITPELGTDPLHGEGTRSYTWTDGDGAAGTYTAGFTNYPETGDAWDASFSGITASEGMDITLIYEGATRADNVYDVKLKTTSFSQYYDATYTPNDATGDVSLTYRGKITPLS